MSASDGLIFCDICKPFRNLDRILSSEPLNHHKSWTELCKSANQGCQLCQAFVRGQAQCDKRLKNDFDKDKGFPATQLVWRSPCSHPGLHIFQQGGLFVYPHREVVNLWFNMYTAHDDPLASIISERPIQEHSNSQECFDMMDKWIKQCRNEHHDCSWSNDHTLPTRVIDIGDYSSSVPYLVTTNGASGEWVTLSHCWGGKMPMITTLETLSARLEGIPMTDLPPTFRDAVEITRKLGFRYLWIDTFCIIQDCREDWGRESTKMHEIYANASLCIAASAAPNAEAGIFASADRERHISRPLISFSSSHSGNNMSGTVSLRHQMSSFPYRSIDRENLHQRAWALQEKLLAQRAIDFSSPQILWSCRKTAYSERDPTLVQREARVVGRALYRFPTGRLLDPWPNINYFGRERHGKHIIDWWYETLRNYTTRSITKHSDLLPAISGIAQAVAGRSGYSYAAGLWKEDFHRGLLWQSWSTIKKEPDTTIPSWSWASTRLSWTSTRRLDLHTYGSGSKARIVELTTTNNTGNPYAEVIASCLKIEGSWKPLSSWMGDVIPVYNNARWLDDMQIAHRWLSEAKTAIPLKVPPQDRVICTLDERPPRVEDLETYHQSVVDSGAIILQIARFKHESPHSSGCKHRTHSSTAFALILQPTENQEAFKRIGIAEIPTENGMADDWDARIVTIV